MSIGSEEITIGQILTAIVAVYGALLSSANLILQLRSKRWRVVVSYSTGRRLVAAAQWRPADSAGEVATEEWRDLLDLRIANFGERNVTITGIIIRRRRKWFETLSKWILHVLSRPHVTTEGFFNMSLLVEELKLPLELSPGESTGISFRQAQIIHYARLYGFDRPTNFRIVVKDALGYSYKSHPIHVDTRKWTINGKELVGNRDKVIGWGHEHYYTEG